MNAQRLILELLDRMSPGARQRQDVERALSQLDQGLCNLLVRWGTEQHLGDAIAPRVAVVLAHQVLIHVADDVADGECEYFEHDIARAATTQFTLHNLAGFALQQSAVDHQGCARFLLRMAQVAAAQHEEVAAAGWCLTTAKQAARGLNGVQMQAYLEFLSHGCDPSAAGVGYSYGIAAHVSRDVATRDARYVGLTSDARAALRGWAREHALRVHGAGSPIFKRQIQPVFRHLG